jgi:hypothetical protein
VFKNEKKRKETETLKKVLFFFLTIIMMFIFNQLLLANLSKKSLNKNGVIDGKAAIYNKKKYSNNLLIIKILKMIL